MLELEVFLAIAENLQPENNKLQFKSWYERVSFFLKENFVHNEVEEYFINEASLVYSSVYYSKMSEKDKIFSYDLAKARKALRNIMRNTTYQNSPQKSENIGKNFADNRKIFVVHGHDKLKLNLVTSALEKLNFIPVVIGNEPNKGLTIIEKIEKHSEVGFCVVLMTSDDIGASKNDHKLQKYDERPRQNVLIEFGYFWGKFGRNRVCLFNSIDGELASDLKGLGYTHLGDNNAWKMELVKELKAAGFDADANLIL